ncbi:YggT family protein [Anaerotignum sp. MB30-C6]|uniref:YggT family protein n=1 Tax=Anaerotignum sp. MB30-C6 TaxID=3070814 RepID=UPI0027DDD1BE|nr:YggT family protein [Anaerotignum sp. MB30-C6]WMI82045.1 YggT family protein [Anaerotignum sp. MB30-C6]
MNSLQILLMKAVNLFFYVMELLIFGRILLSWLPMGYNNPIGQFLYAMTEPILGPCRRMLDKSPLGGGMMLDFSPIIALILMMLTKELIVGAIMLL